jgi:hypothetical protein
MILIAVLGFIVGVITGAAALAGFAMWATGPARGLGLSRLRTKA